MKNLEIGFGTRVGEFKDNLFNLFEISSRGSDVVARNTEIRSDYYEVLGDSITTMLLALVPGFILALLIYEALGRRGRAPMADAIY